MADQRGSAWSAGFWVFSVAAIAAGWCAGGDVGLRDSGELGAAGFTLGVAHPTGFALDLLLLRAASLVPLGHVAFRQNALIALEAALCLGLLAEIGVLLARRAGVRGAALSCAALLPAAALCGWATFVQSALATEVYMLALCAVALAAYGCLLGGRARSLALCVAGLAPGMHVTAGLYAAGLFAASFARDGLQAGTRFVAGRMPALIACLAVTAYLPLASRRDPAIDWGDPETLGRVFEHLSAARIRDAFHGDMLTAAPDTSYRITAQWLELWPALIAAAIAIVLALRRDRAGVLGASALLAADLAYAAWINPMGAVDRQVGHVAGAALAVLGGVGVALLCARLPERARVLAPVGAAALACALVLRLPASAWPDGYAASELVGSGGPLSAVPPRSIVVCSEDDGCAGGLFALHVEAVRPDVSVVPGQHLWDPTVRRLLYATSLQRATLPEEAQRSDAADVAVRRLASGAEPRPVLWTSTFSWKHARVPGALRPSRWLPLLQQPASELAPDALLARLDRALAARAPEAAGFRAWPADGRVRAAWGEAFTTLGSAQLDTDPRAAVAALTRATELSPGRASTWTNLGVALEAAGHLGAAERSVRRALELDPLRATAWVNFARLRLVLAGPDAARGALDDAFRAGVQDPRLDALAEQLQP